MLSPTNLRTVNCTRLCLVQLLSALLVRINPKYHSKPCYYTYKFSVALFTWGGVLVFVVPMVCGCMGHITAWGGNVQVLWILNL